MTAYDITLMCFGYVVAMLMFALVTVVSDAEGITTITLRLCRRVTTRYKLRVIVFIVVMLLWPLPALELLARSVHTRFRGARSAE